MPRMKVAILGYDMEGKASANYFSNLGHDITICDRDAQKIVPEGVEACLGDGYLDNLDRFDLLVRTPGLRPSLILDKNPGIGPKITSGTNEFFRQCAARNIQNIIGVTGTKGKGTTTTLIAKMLEASGHIVHLGGNIGVPALELLPNIHPGARSDAVTNSRTDARMDTLTEAHSDARSDARSDEWVVLELSSFQLTDLQASPHIAVCLMVAPEHQDWHTDIEEYYTAKEQLFARQLPGDIAIYYHENNTSKRIARAGQSRKIPYYHVPGAEVTDGSIVIESQLICKTSELKLLGAHNWQNACAAVTAAWQVTQDIEAIRSVLTSFSGLEHRLEFVREINGVKYYDDSFGTTPETAIVALQAFAHPKVAIIAILGGSDKGASYEELAAAVKASNVRKVLLIGDQAGRIQAALDEAGYRNYGPGGNTMAEIVANAAQSAEAGDIVLLSTGCASFGMFRNYKDRGNQFKQTVAQLA